MSRRHLGILLAAPLAITLATPACGLGDRAALEDLITRAPARADGRGLVAGTLTVESRFVEGPDPQAGGGAAPGAGLPAGAEDFRLPEGGFSIGAQSVDFAMNTASSQATLQRTGDPTPVVYMNDLVWFGRRFGVPAADARPWVRLHVRDIDENAGELNPFEGATVSVAALNPALITDLAAGTLTGSIKRRGRSVIDGVSTTHYAVNVSLDKALGDRRRARYPEDKRETVDELIRVLGVTGNLHPADVWIDDDGLLRRFSVALVQRPVPRVEFALVVTVDYAAYGGRYLQQRPTPQEVLTVDTVLHFIRVVTAPPATESPEATSAGGTTTQGAP